MVNDTLHTAVDRLHDANAALERDLQRLHQLERSLASSHRCWPSRVGWGVVLFLLVYILLLHSFYGTERTIMWEESKAGLQEQFDTLLARHAKEMSQAVTNAEYNVRSAWEEAVRRVHLSDLILQAYETPQVKKDVEILQRLERLEARP